MDEELKNPRTAATLDLDWKRLWQSFDALLEQPPEQRRHWLQARHGHEPELLADLEALLDAHQQRNSPLDRAALGLLAADAMPEQLGEWQILEALGEGGMGRVHLARRSDGDFEQLAAIKLLDRGDAQDPLFLSERRSLARLRHPAIAQFHDSGIDPVGRPYLVLEYVEGERLDQWVAHRPDLPRRIRLLIEVCRAIDHAHRQLVLHLDLKPGNVLVTAQDQPKLIDFGIASAPGEGAGQRPLTPAYASPEQLRGQPLGTASDVFALGALLYWLCTGSSPWPDVQGRAERLQRIAEGPPRLAARAQLGPEHPLRGLARWRRAELDLILARALDFEPDRRYPSAEALATELERWLQLRPLASRRATTGYRLRCWVARHPLASTATALALALLLGFMHALAWQAGQLRRALELAQNETRRAETAASFLAELFTEADPEVHQGRPPSLAELLERGAGRLEAIAEPRLRAELALLIGRALAHQSAYTAAIPLLHAAAEYGETGTRAEALQSLGRIAEEQARYAEAEALQRQALALTESLPAERHAAAGLRLAALLERQHRLDEAAEVIDGLETDLEVPALRAELSLRRGSQAFARGRFDEATVHYRDALGELSQTADRDAPRVARASYGLAVSLHRRGEHESAREHYEQALVLRQSVYGDLHPRVAEVVSALAALEYETGRHERSVELSQASLERLGQLHGPQSPVLAQSYNNLGLALHALGAFEAAAQAYQEALARHLLARDPTHPHVLSSYGNLALLALDRGEAAAARAELENLLPRADSALPDTHPVRAALLHLAGRAALESGDPGQARAFLSAALQLRSEGDPSALADTLYWLAWAAAADEDFEAARTEAGRVLALRIRAHGEADWRSAASRVQLAALQARPDADAAEPTALDEALADYARLRGAQHWTLPALARRAHETADRLAQIRAATAQSTPARARR